MILLLLTGDLTKKVTKNDVRLLKKKYLYFVLNSHKFLDPKIICLTKIPTKKQRMAFL